jgi:hypothetical protein
MANTMQTVLWQFDIALTSRHDQSCYPLAALTLPPSPCIPRPCSILRRKFTHDRQGNTQHCNVQRLTLDKCSSNPAIIPPRGLVWAGPCISHTQRSQDTMHRPRQQKIEDVVWHFFGCPLKAACFSTKSPLSSVRRLPSDACSDACSDAHHLTLADLTQHLRQPSIHIANRYPSSKMQNPNAASLANVVPTAGLAMSAVSTITNAQVNTVQAAHAAMTTADLSKHVATSTACCYQRFSLLALDQ